MPTVEAVAEQARKDQEARAKAEQARKDQEDKEKARKAKDKQDTQQKSCGGDAEEAAKKAKEQSNKDSANKPYCKNVAELKLVTDVLFFKGSWSSAKQEIRKEAKKHLETDLKGFSLPKDVYKKEDGIFKFALTQNKSGKFKWKEMSKFIDKDSSAADVADLCFDLADATRKSQDGDCAYMSQILDEHHIPQQEFVDFLMQHSH